MQEPILEALTFSLESDLMVENDGSKEGNSRRGFVPSSHTVGTISSAVALNSNSSVQCLMPNCEFVSSPIKDVGKVGESNILEHLLRVHHFVIDSVEQVANIQKYFSYWREKFQSNKLEEFCVIVMMDRPLLYEDVKKECNLKTFREQGSVAESSSSSPGDAQLDSKKFYMLTPALPEDSQLRQKLWNDRLELVLEINRMEREQTDFSRQCLFCKEVCNGNRLVLFQHMFESHSFHIGQPDNVVFVNELLDFVEDKLNANECIYCAKIFKDKTVLREHMRKKQHKRLNPSNRDYDKFYVINYLEAGKSWKALDEEDPEDERREEEWVETRNEETSIVCLFCSHQDTDFDSVLTHMKSRHNFDFRSLTAQLNFYQKVKIVNFIRRNIHLNVCLHCERKFFEKVSLLEHVEEHHRAFSSGSQTFPDVRIWDRAEYFFPTYENDQFLVMLDNDASDDMVVDSDTGSVESLVVIPEDLPPVAENAFLKQEFS